MLLNINETIRESKILEPHIFIWIICFPITVRLKHSNRQVQDFCFVRELTHHISEFHIRLYHYIKPVK